MANKSKNNSKSGGFVQFIKYYIINFIGCFIVFPVADLIMAAISHREFHYNVVSYIVSAAIWALILGIIEFFWQRQNGKNN